MGGTFCKDTDNYEVYNVIWGIYVHPILYRERTLLKEERK